MVTMKPTTVTVGDNISGKTYTGIAMMDEDPSSNRVVVATKTEKYLFNLDDKNVVVIEK